MTHPCHRIAGMGLRRATAAIDFIEEADNNGFRASTYWVLARGLAADITDAAWSNPDSPIPTPGLDRIQREIADSVHECHGAVDDAFSLDGPEPPDSDTLLSLEMSLVRSAQALQQVATLTRRIAQLGLGVSEALDPRDYSTDRLRQACAAVVFMYPFEPSGVLDDGVAMASRNIHEFTVEFSGLVARMILEREIRIHIYVDSLRNDPTIGRRHLLVSVDDDSIRVADNHGSDSEWCLHRPAREVCEFVVESVLDHLGHHGDSLDGVRVSLI